jgi:hypothetical protein
MMNWLNSEYSDLVSEQVSSSSSVEIRNRSLARLKFLNAEAKMHAVMCFAGGGAW